MSIVAESTPTRAAFTQLHEAITNIEAAQSLLQEATDALPRALSSVAAESEAWQAGVIYWECQQIPVNMVAAAFGMTTRQRIDLASETPYSTGESCGPCGAELFASTRDELNKLQARARKRESSPECPACARRRQAIIQDQHKQRCAEQRDELAALKRMPYRDYLQSARWKTTRGLAISRAKGRCAACYASGPLQVHHRTYERIGEERLSDLTVLCPDCHDTFHQERELS